MATGSRCKPQTPSPGPRRSTRKTLAQQQFLDTMQIPWEPRCSSGRQRRSGTRTAAAGRKTRQRALLALPFRGLSWSPRRAARWLCPQPLPPQPPPRAGSGSRLDAPRPERQAPPPRPGPAPGLRLRPSTLADNLAEPRGPTVVCTRAVTTAAPAASPASAFAAVVAVAADALHRQGSPDLSMGR